MHGAGVALEPFGDFVDRVTFETQLGDAAQLVVAEDVSPRAEAFYQSMCPAGVYEQASNGLVVNAPNCVDCKATDVLGPRWTPREGGSGPKYKRM